MNYKLIAIDMDGTLLNSDNKVSDRTLSAIENARKKNVHIVLATGRILISAEQYAEQMKLNNDIIACNGAVILDKNKEIIHERTISKETAKKIMELAQEYNIYYHFYDRSSFYSNIYISEIVNYYNIDNAQLINVNIFEDFNEILNDDLKIYKFLFLDKDQDKLINLRNQLAKIDGINLSSSWDNNIEVVKDGVCKGSSLEFLCKRLNISPEEVIAIGDNENDLSMIDFAGLGVAMSNAVNLVKEKAAIVTSSNNDDGVAKIIEQYILETGDGV